MDRISQSKALIMGTGLALLLVLISFWPVREPAVLKFVPSPAKKIGHKATALSRKVLHHKTQAATETLAPLVSAVPQASAKIETPFPELRGATLRPFDKAFTYIFLGRVICGDKPCPAEVELIVNTADNPDKHFRASVDDTGAFRISVSFWEDPQQQIEWRLTARTPDWMIGEVHGRRILLDDGIVTVDEQLRPS